MKIVTYNVNGLRARVQSFKTLRNFLDSLDADIVCLQETKISRQELTSEIAIAEGYESFFSCTRTVKKGRVGYSGVATFCRVGCTPSESPILPVVADEGFTGLLHMPQSGQLEDDKARVGCYNEVLSMEGFTKQDLLNLDSEGRCLVTDHGAFVLFNIYGPNSGCEDLDRQQFKLNFFKVLQCRWQSLLKQGRRIIVVGDFNISPFAIDSCDPGPAFENNLSRKLLRSLLESGGGFFSDVFRIFHPDRKEAYTCWSQASGAEEFNYGTRIDLMLVSGHCVHGESSSDGIGHSFAKCQIVDCDILHAFKRYKPDSLPRWSGGRSIKLDGSDHAPVYMQLKELPSVILHDVPPLAARYRAELRGRQQTIVSLLQKPEKTKKLEPYDVECSGQQTNSRNVHASEDNACALRTGGYTEKGSICFSKKDGRLFQSSLRQFCTTRSLVKHGERKLLEVQDQQVDAQLLASGGMEPKSHLHVTDITKNVIEEVGSENQDNKSVNAAAEWKRIKQLMAQSTPLCKGHKEPCVVRTVKKSGPNVGRSFYVCARAKGPTTNAQARCDHFEWAVANSKGKRKEVFD